MTVQLPGYWYAHECCCLTCTEWRKYLADVALVCMVAATVDDRTPDEDAALSRLTGGVS